MSHFQDIAGIKSVLRRIASSRMFAWLLVAVIVLTVLFKIALPLFVSTASVKANMERVLSSWTGAKASITGDPEISFWPHPVLTLKNVTFEGGDAATPQLLARAKAISAGFEILAALRGTPVFYDFRLVDPVLNIERRNDGSFNWRRAGWLADAVADAASGNPADTASSTPIGDIEIENGLVELSDSITNTRHRITDITGTIAWPTPAARMQTNLSARMNGQAVEWSFACEEPVTLLSGKSSAIEMSFTSGLLTFGFEGMASGSAYPFASGQVQLNIGSIPALAAWYRASPSPTAASGALTMDTTVTLADTSLKMDNLSLALDGAAATGVLDIGWSRATPRIEGTLAFDKLDLEPLLGALSSLVPKSPADGSLDTERFKQIGLDLRLSAEQVGYGPVVLTDVAAGIMAENGRASIDIGGASYAGGALSGRVALAKDGANGGQFQLALKNADLAPIVSILGLQGPLPLGRGVLSIDLSTTDPLSTMTTSSLEGEIRYLVNDGTLTNFNAASFEQRVGQSGFFTVDKVADGSFAFTTAEISAQLKRGVAELTKADIHGEGRTLSLAGVVPYRTGGLALAGALRPDDRTKPAASFFVGGSWPNPVISPLSAVPAQP